MNRRDLLKRAAILPVVGLGTLLASSTPAEAGKSKGGGSLFGKLVNIFPGGFGPESFNGGDIVIKIRDASDQLLRTALVDKKTKIFIGGEKIKYRDLLDEVYTNQQTLLHNLQDTDVIVSFSTGLKAKQIDISNFVD